MSCRFGVCTLLTLTRYGNDLSYVESRILQNGHRIRARVADSTDFGALKCLTQTFLYKMYIQQ